MTERRPHWDDDLITAVMSALPEYAKWTLVSDDVFRIIAAVEDWHKEKRDSRIRTHSEGCWRWHQECAEHLIEWQRSTIQRVRELLDDECFSQCSCGHCPILVDARDVRRTLDGERDG